MEDSQFRLVFKDGKLFSVEIFFYCWFPFYNYSILLHYQKKLKCQQQKKIIKESQQSH
jgi:hypothetical protein